MARSLILRVEQVRESGENAIQLVVSVLKLGWTNIFKV